MTFTVYDHADAHTIPTASGIYLFYLEAISPAKIGLRGDQTRHTPAQQSAAKAALVDRFRRTLALMHSGEMGGEISQSAKASHMAEKFVLSGRRVLDSALITRVEELPLDQVFAYAEVAKTMACMLQPVYVGLTARQTLRQRYEQHLANFESPTSSGSFGSRVRESGFGWDDLLFACIPIDLVELPSPALRSLEMHAQMLGRPAYSIS